MKKAIIIVLSIIIVFEIFTRTASLLYPIDIIEIKCEDITKNIDTYRLYDNMDLTNKIKEHPESYMVLHYDIKIKNNTNKEMFIEHYKYKITYSYIHYEDRVEFYDQYELKSNEEETLRGIFVIETKGLDNKDILQEAENKSKLKIKYWVYIKNFPLFAKTKITP